ncbi:MAG: hypothetical protein HYU84_07090 [Chloroflexi bacterium]|nr:hypothetical protein [Chloroflexota bacterium]
MNTIKRISPFFAVLIFASLACGLPAASSAETQPTETAAQPSVQAEAGEAVLLFTIGIHIEPMGETAQGFSGGKGGDYHQPQFFERQAQDILTVAQLVESHGGHMTVQAQSPFTTDAHMGKNSSALQPLDWCNVLKEEIGYITQATSSPQGGGVTDIRYWSGGNLYVDIYEAAECAGLDVNSDWKNPNTQSTDMSLTGVNPWRPAGGTDGTDFTLFTQNDPNGAIIFLPEGQYDKTDFAASRRSDEAGGDEAYFEYLKESLYASLAAAEPGKVNVFHFTVHPGEFRGDRQDPFGVIERFLAEVVDPLVASGDVQWATFSEMADAYAAIEQ